MVAHRKAGPNIAARRVAGEVADRVVATRLTKSEHEALEALAKGRGVSPGLLVRAWVQSAAGGVLQAVPPAPAEPTIDELLDRLVVEEAEDELKRVSEEAINGLDVVRRRRRDKRWRDEGIRPPADGAELPNVGLRAVPVNDPDDHYPDPQSVPCPKKGCPAKRAGDSCYDSRGMALPLGRVHKERSALAARQLQLAAPSPGRRS